MAIYTKTGDAGETSLRAGKRIRKDDVRIHVLGTIDELNASIGLLIAEIASAHPPITTTLATLQSTLFSIGAYLAHPTQPAEQGISLSDHVIALETAIDTMEQSLEPLHNFILPGGSKHAALAHLCRTIARRCERVYTECTHSEPLPPEIAQYLNRISDYFFVLARFLNQLNNTPDRIWKQ